METNIDIIMKYKGTAVWYAYQIIDECSLRDDLMTAAARGTYTQAEQDEIRGIAVRFCKTCNMVSFASDVAMCAMLNGVTKVDDGSAICADTLDLNEYRIKKGETPAAIFANCGFSPAYSYRISQASAEVLDPRRIQAGFPYYTLNLRDSASTVCAIIFAKSCRN